MTERGDSTPTHPVTTETSGLPESGVPSTRPVLHPIPRWVIAAGVPVMLAVAGGAAWLLLGRGATTGQLDALRTAGALGIGLGGLVGLWLAVRRQRSAELDLLHKYETHQLAVRVAAQNQAVADRAAAHAEHDAHERRLTELYLKAVEQLGSDKAAVRHGGLYALERVAQNNPDQRQTIVDVICAYLRTPHALPGASGSPRLGVRRPLMTSTSARTTVAQQKLDSASGTLTRAQADSEARQEREVRLTAQRLLCRHLRPGHGEHPDASFWDGINLDLNGAVLYVFDFRHCAVNEAWFIGARFVENANFEDAKFSGNAWFIDSKFANKAYFKAVEFAGIAAFDDVEVAGYAQFSYAKFDADAGFREVKFSGNTSFAGAKFSGGTGFTGARFAGGISFNGARFAGDVYMDEVEFACEAFFGDVTFGDLVRIDETTFARGVPPGVAPFADQGTGSETQLNLHGHSDRSGDMPD
ncbi:pentapeptide repeat-containing protein [Amycolatopsis sp. cg9]|uniref:pentapeptide repeat-containing protein n=1 Tax=Amycolatopsis sp. cg9 TaxID=3238801 RepID=UPI003526AE2B